MNLLTMLARTTAAIAAAGLVAFGCSSSRDELVEIITNARVIYVCEKTGDDYVIRKVLRNSLDPAIAVRPGTQVLPNYKLLKIPVAVKPFQLAILVNRRELNPVSGINAGQSELPITPEGVVSGFRVTYQEFEKLVAQESSK